MSAATLRSSTLRLPGAGIYHEIQGTGPLLLIIPGGPQDAGVFADLARALARHYTVVTYDPRGNSRSRFDGPPTLLDLDRQADDALALITSLTRDPAYVLGASGGAQIGLNLAARHPRAVRTLVAHEPPTASLLDDPSEALAEALALHDTYLSQGVEAAMTRFFGSNGLEEGPPMEEIPGDVPGTDDAAETFARVSGNFEYWLAHGILPLTHFQPDIVALRAGPVRVVVGLGEASAGQSIHAMGMALARKLEVEPVIFPGDHLGFESHREAFAAILHQTFSGR